jgi:hypothetical protein
MLVTSLVVASLLAQTEPAKDAPPPAAPTPPTMPMPVDSKPIPPPFTPKVTPYGFINFQWSMTDAPSPKPGVNTFEFRRARVGLKGDVTKEIGFTIIYDGADNSLKDAFGIIRYVPGLELRVGQFKTPFGYEQQEADTKLLWVYNSYVVQALARGRDSRDDGVLAAGKWKLGDILALELSAAGVNGAGPNTKDDLNEKNAWGRGGIAISAAGTTTRLGGSYGYGHQVAFAGADAKFGVQGSGASATLDDTYFYFHTAGADVTFDSKWLFVAAEWIQSKRHVTRFTAPTTGTTTDITPKGWYVGAYSRSPWNAGLIFRAEKARLPTSSGAAQGTALNADWNERYTVGAYYDVLPVSARLILNYELDESPVAIQTGDRFIVYTQVMF